LHHGSERLAGEELAAVSRESDVVVTSYDIATRDVEDLCQVQWDRLLPTAHGKKVEERREESGDEACACVASVAGAAASAMNGHAR